MKLWRAKIPNSNVLAPSLPSGRPLGHWFFPGRTFHGGTSFQWLEAGAFLIMHSSIEEPEIRNGIAQFSVPTTQLMMGACCISMASLGAPGRDWSSRPVFAEY